MPELHTRRRLDQPRVARRFAVNIDPDAFGRFSERLARLLGTGKFLFWQTLVVVVWVALNLAAVSLQWDPYPFILLNLAFSTQAAYAAPLILLAQNRQDDRDRVSLEEDRTRAAQTKADTEFLARELASLRIAVGEVATRDYLRSELDKLRSDLNTKPRKGKRKGPAQHDPAKDGFGDGTGEQEKAVSPVADGSETGESAVAQRPATDSARGRIDGPDD